MKYFIDLEFIELGPKHPTELISVGIMAEDERKYYAISTEFSAANASDWVVANVLSSLPPMAPSSKFMGSTDQRWDPHQYSSWKNDYWRTNEYWRTRAKIRETILQFIGDDESPEFWGEWCSYDWVVLCQIFGTMMDLPKGWPMRCRDVVQLLEDQLSLSQDSWPQSLEVDGNHSALLGAMTVKSRFDWCMSQV